MTIDRKRLRELPTDEQIALVRRVAATVKDTQPTWSAALSALLDALEAQPPTDDARDARLYRAVNRAARELPVGYIVSVHAEHNAGWVELHRNGERVDFGTGQYETLADEFGAAIDAAIAERTKEQG